MKLTTVKTFYTNYTQLVQRLLLAKENFKVLNKYYTSVGLGSLITDGTDFGLSAQAVPKLFPFFDDLKNCTTNFVLSMGQHVEQYGIYTAIGLSGELGDSENIGDGLSGAELKSALTSMAALEANLISAYHYTNLFKIVYTADRQAIDWVAGILGSEVKAVITSMAASDTFLTSGYHYTNLDKLL